ncbi:OCIA domain-containing protein 1-like [Rhagoletis pomonella]|uniref:OCIA domain-containing protein 1-like n=1 Tax=Rhagoletis pomonella TaxID=28610 RepID=UPI001780F582|nr:OCIA domain-containing protein 1-like [Rhagoletis pomonella]
MVTANLLPLMDSDKGPTVSITTTSKGLQGVRYPISSKNNPNLFALFLLPQNAWPQLACRKSGYLQPNFKYGAVPKVVVGVIIGYFLGKFSYQQKCAEKLMRLPNSRLGELLKQRRKDGGVMGRLNPDQGMGIGLGLNPFNSTLSSTNEDLGRELPRSSALNLDVETRPSIAGLDDIYRPTLDNPSPFYETDVPIDQAKHGLSYEELRKKNREEYEKKQQNPYSRPLSANAPVVIRENEALKAPFGSDSNTSTSTRGHKNKYGDTWTD